ncbi:hypothetical protein BIW11_03454 [Tropilaelaps mercedesae]|uniref:Uncharacterized protein n=1 Tax=Tropilaelaps mercedesae TaxID=418985 RepID=A0A1V9XL03_9ACAR|nr:hypothetical protein BIW11_03454 [Tropilaelaps mercedesae]
MYARPKSCAKVPRERGTQARRLSSRRGRCGYSNTGRPQRSSESGVVPINTSPSDLQGRCQRFRLHDERWIWQLREKGQPPLPLHPAWLLYAVRNAQH